MNKMPDVCGYLHSFAFKTVTFIMKFFFPLVAAEIAIVAFLTQSFIVTAFHFRFFRTATFCGHPSILTRKQLFSNAPNKNAASTDSAPMLVAIVAPLHYQGPYPCLSLRFPGTGSRAKTPLNFLLDTGANVNAISRRVVKDWDFTEVSLPAEKKPAVATAAAGMGGSLEAPAAMYTLGDCQLHGMPAGQDEFIFLRNLTAAALPMQQDGILGLQFFWSFPAGVEFDWFGTEGDPPTVVFYVGSELPKEVAKSSNLHRFALKALPTQILSLTIQIHSTNTTNATTTTTRLEAIVDTGSPVTVLSHQAAKQVGIETIDVSKKQTVKRPFWNYSLKQQSGDDRLVVGGVDGRIVTLRRSVSPVTIQVQSSDTNDTVCLGHGHVYVGELPGMAFLGGIPSRTKANMTVNSSLPSVVLGLDILKQTYRMVVSASRQEIWLEELHDQSRARKAE